MVLKILLLIDIIFIFGHILIALFWDFEPRAFMVDTDNGFPELYQYFKYLLIIGFALYLVLANRMYNYFPWIVLFFILLLDDAFQFHERSGKFLADFFDLHTAFGLRAVDFGELLYAASVGFFIMAALAFSYYRGTYFFRKTCLDMLFLFSVFLFFGIGIDMVHQWLVDVYMLSAVVALIEDGGEMLALSFMVWYFYLVASQTETNRPFLIDYFIRDRWSRILLVNSPEEQIEPID